MSDLPQQLTLDQYVADGATTIYTYSYLLLKAADIAVYVTPPGQTAIPDADIRVLNVDYTVQNVGTVTGGTITFTTAPVSGATVTLDREMEYSLDTEFKLAKTFNGENLDNALGRLLLLTQQLNTTIKFRVFSYAINTYLPVLISSIMPKITNVDNQIWKSQGGAVIASLLEENPDSSTLRSDLANETPHGNGASIVGYYDVNSDTPTNLSHYLNSEKIYGHDSGTVNHVVISLPNADITIRKGTQVIFRPAYTNTGDSDITFISTNGTHSYGIYRKNGTLIQPQDFKGVAAPDAGYLVVLTYDGANFVITGGSCGQYLDWDSGDTLITSRSGPVLGFIPFGSAPVSRALYNELFAAIGTTWGVGDGSTTFGIPPARITPVASGGAGDAFLGNAEGDTGGVGSSVLVAANHAAHTHTGSGGSITGGAAGDSEAGITFGSNTQSQTLAIDNLTTPSQGSGTAFSNWQPSGIFNFHIKI